MHGKEEERNPSKRADDLKTAMSDLIAAVTQGKAPKKKKRRKAKEGEGGEEGEKGGEEGQDGGEQRLSARCEEKGQEGDQGEGPVPSARRTPASNLFKG